MAEATPSIGLIIDVHTHALLPVWVKAIQKLFSDRPASIAGAPVPDWSAQGHLAMMDQHEIAAGLLSWPGATSFFKGQAAKDLARAMNEAFASLVSQHPGRFGAFAVTPVDDIDIALDEAAYALDVLKLDGLALTTHAGGHYLGEPYFDPLFEELHRRGATLFVHPGPPPGFDLAANGLNVAILEFMFESTRMAANMVLSGAKARFDRINIICTHGGGTLPYLAHRIGVLEPLFGAGNGRPTLPRQAILDGLASFYYDLTAATSAAQLDAMRRLVPASRLLMGFDYPMMPAAEIPPAKALLQAYGGLTAEETALIARANAARRQTAHGAGRPPRQRPGLGLSVRTTAPGGPAAGAGSWLSGRHHALGQFAPDDDLLDLSRAFIDPEHAHIAIEPLDHAIAHIARAARSAIRPTISEQNALAHGPLGHPLAGVVASRSMHSAA